MYKTKKRCYASLFFHTVPLTVKVAIPGAVIHSPVTGFWVNVAAGTVIAPLAVANNPLVSS